MKEIGAGTLAIRSEAGKLPDLDRAFAEIKAAFGRIDGHTGMAGASVYGASKAAVINLAKGFSSDLLARGIRVNAVSPGPITTPILDRMGMPAKQLKQTKHWITSPESSFVIGTEIIVDGGMVTL